MKRSMLSSAAVVGAGVALAMAGQVGVAHAVEYGCVFARPGVQIERCADVSVVDGYAGIGLTFIHDRGAVGADYLVALENVRLQRKNSSGDFLTIAVHGDYDGWQEEDDTAPIGYPRSNVCGTYRAVVEFKWHRRGDNAVTKETRVSDEHTKTCGS